MAEKLEEQEVQKVQKAQTEQEAQDVQDVQEVQEVRTEQTKQQTEPSEEKPAEEYSQTKAQKQQKHIEELLANLPKRTTRRKPKGKTSGVAGKAGKAVAKGIGGLIFRFIRPIGLLVLLALVIWGICRWWLFAEHERPAPQIITEATLEQIIDINELSTLEAVYTGIAAVHNESVPSLVNYYVYYEAKVKAGIDADQIDMKVDTVNKNITVTLPKAKITDIIVDIASLDYIFVNVSYNKPSVTQEAYQKCVEDVTKESAEETAICELAQENARNMVEAMIDPFVQQLDEDYVLTIK